MALHETVIGDLNRRMLMRCCWKGILARMLALTGGFSVELPGIEPTAKKA